MVREANTASTASGLFVVLFRVVLVRVVTTGACEGQRPEPSRGMKDRRHTQQYPCHSAQRG